MIYIADIVFRDNVIFPDSGKLDLDNHPTINITDKVDNKVYFLGITSETSSYASKLDTSRKQVLRPIPGTPITRPSIIKLDHILVEEYKYRSHCGSISPEFYDLLISKLHKTYTPDCGGIDCGCSTYKKTYNE